MEEVKNKKDTHTHEEETIEAPETEETLKSEIENLTSQVTDAAGPHRIDH
jgi:hypothetical protein